MKILGPLVFLAGLLWTWQIAVGDRALNEAVHIGIQDDLRRVIVEYIEEHLPTAKNFEFNRFWTEAVSDSQVKAYFEYSFEDKTETTPEAKVRIQGYAVLNKRSESEEVVEWTFDELYIEDNQVTFKDPIVVAPGQTSPAEVK